MDYLGSNTKLYADLSGMKACENPVSTIPEEIAVTSAGPDNVLVGEDIVTLIELTIPHHPLESFLNAIDCRSRKETYLQGLSNMKAKGLTSKFAHD